MAVAHIAACGLPERLAIGSAHSVYSLIPPITGRFGSVYPNVKLPLMEATAAPSVEGMKAGRVDVALVRSTPVAEEVLETEVISREPFVLALPAGHPATRSRPEADGERAVHPVPAARTVNLPATRPCAL